MDMEKEVCDIYHQLPFGDAFICQVPRIMKSLWKTVIRKESTRRNNVVGEYLHELDASRSSRYVRWKARDWQPAQCKWNDTQKAFQLYLYILVPAHIPNKQNKPYFLARS